MNNKKNTLLIIFVTFVVTSALYMGMHIFAPVFSNALNNIASFLTPGFGGNGRLGEIKKIIEDNYINETDSDKLENNALKGYVAALDDPYSEYYTKEELEEITSQLSGHYKGIGVEVNLNDEGLIAVLAVYEDAPASKAGIIPGDLIINVNGTDADESNYNEAISMIKGSGKYGESDKLVLTIRRGDKTLKKELTREEVSIQTVKSEMLENGIGYIRLSRFAEESASDFEIAVNNLISSGAASLIIDLRDNPGGTLTSVVALSDFLLPEGNILTIKGRNTPPQEYSSDKECIDLPMCVIINSNSASASEVLAGALKAHKKATIVGETSFGKGVVQTMFQLNDNSAVKITTSKYYTPDGKCIHGEGIKPDHEVIMELTKPLSEYSRDEDIQLQKAIEVLN